MAPGLTLKGTRGEEDPCGGGDEAQGGEGGGERRKKGGPEAQGGEKGNGFGAFQQASGVVERLFALRGGLKPALFGEDGVAQKRGAVDVKAGEQEGPGGGVGRITQHKGQGDRAVKGKIADDVEVAAKIGFCGRAGDGAVQPVGDAPGEQRDQREPSGKAKRQNQRGGQAEGEAREGDLRGADAARGKDAAAGVQGRINQAAHHRIKHGIWSLTPPGAGGRFATIVTKAAAYVQTCRAFPNRPVRLHRGAGAGALFG